MHAWWEHHQALHACACRRLSYVHSECFDHSHGSRMRPGEQRHICPPRTQLCTHNMISSACCGVLHPNHISRALCQQVTNPMLPAVPCHPCSISTAYTILHNVKQDENSCTGGHGKYAGIHSSCTGLFRPMQYYSQRLLQLSVSAGRRGCRYASIVLCSAPCHDSHKTRCMTQMYVYILGYLNKVFHTSVRHISLTP